MKLLVVIPGFGEPHAPLKRAILDHNIQLIRSTFVGDITLRIFNYGEKKGFEYEHVQVEETVEKGVVGQFLYRFITSDYIESEQYDYVMILLDDIKLQNDVHVDTLIQFYNTYNYNIMSPSLTRTSKYEHEYMLSTQQPTIRCVNGLELFCYILNKESYIKYYSLLDEQSAWLWGIDLVLRHKGFKCGIVDCMTIHHYIKNESYRPDLPDPHKEMRDNFVRFDVVKADMFALIDDTIATDAV